MRARFIALHTIAIALHTFCFVYAFSQELAYDSPIPVELRRVSYLDAGESYYEEQEPILFHIPSTLVLHGIVALVTVLFHALVYLPIHWKFAPMVWSQGFLTVRWVEYSITCTLVSLSSMMSSGTRDFTIFSSVILLGAALQAIGCSIEQLKEQVRPLLFVGGLINTGISVPTLWYTFSSPGVDSDQWVSLAFYTFFYALFPINCIVDATYRKGQFVKTDWTYVVLSLSSKLALFWIQVGDVNRTRGWIADFQVYVLGILLPLGILAAGLWLTPDAAPLAVTTATKESFYWRQVRRLASVRFLKPPPPPPTIPRFTHPSPFLRMRRVNNAPRLR